MLENPKPEDQTIPPPMNPRACFNRLDITINPILLELMRSHLNRRENAEDDGGDTDFDLWIYGQIYKLEYNSA